MIVQPTASGVLLITQPDHARLSGQVMARSVDLASRPRRDLILLAIAEHDNGWAEEDAAPTIHPNGRIVDFITAPAHVRHAVWPRAVARLADHPWAAALVAQHALTIYERFRSDTEWEPFFKEMQGARDAMARASGVPPRDVADDYAFLRIGDLISLAFCTGSTDDLRFGGWTIRRTGSDVVVAPDMFGGEEIAVEICAREMGRSIFRSDGELREALAAAPIRSLHGVIIGLSGSS